MEWETVGIVLSVSPFGEGDALATVLTAEHGACRGLVRGGRSVRSGLATWDVGNVVRARRVARLADQLGTLSGECLRSPGAMLLDAPLELAALRSACAIAEGSMAEQVTYPRTYDAMLDLVGGLATRRAGLAALVRWEAVLLAELGYGLDLSSCAVTGAVSGLRFVSPRSGRAVTEAAAGMWRERLLRLPSFMLDDTTDADVTPEALLDGLELTGHFLARDAFGQRHKPVPAARGRLMALLARGIERRASEGHGE